MDKEKIDRLLQAAAQSNESSSTEMPFGFDTRVLATWRGNRSGNGADFWEFARVFRRVALSAAAVTALAGSAAFWQLWQNDEFAEPTANAYALADTVIEAGAFQ